MKAARIAGIAALALVFGGVAWYLASPLWTLTRMQNAAEAQQGDALAAYVDFPALREDIKGELSVAMMAEAQQDETGLGALGAALGMAMLDGVIDGMVSPAGIRLMFARSAAPGQAQGSPPVRIGTEDVDIERVGLSEFRVLNVGDGADGALVFHRHGLGWKLAGIDLPPEALARAE